MCAYLINDISKHAVEPKKYFLDTNVWLIIINSFANPNYFEQQYINFFDSLVNKFDEISKEELRINFKSKGKEVTLAKPEILVTPMLLSELFNAYTRSEFREWDSFNGNDNDFKKDYRPTTEHDAAIKKFSSDFFAYEDVLTLTDEKIEEVDPFEIIKNFPGNTDFNDHYYYLYCLEMDASLVTNDGDFICQSIEVLTAHKDLLNINK